MQKKEEANTKANTTNTEDNQPTDKQQAIKRHKHKEAEDKNTTPWCTNIKKNTTTYTQIRKPNKESTRQERRETKGTWQPPKEVTNQEQTPNTQQPNKKAENYRDPYHQKEKKQRIEPQTDTIQ